MHRFLTTFDGAPLPALIKSRRLISAPRLQPGQDRPLTRGELALLEGVFNGALNLLDPQVAPRVMLREKPSFFARQLGVSSTLNITRDNKIHLSESVYSDDLSTSDINSQSIFVHEATHVYQNQTGIDVDAAAIGLSIGSLGNYSSVYAYTIGPGSGWSNYNVEQQANMVQDYFLLSNGYTRAGAAPLAQLQSVIPFTGRH